MVETLKDKFRTWGIEEVLNKYPYLGIEASTQSPLRITGRLGFNVQAPGKEPIRDEYRITISVPEGFPKEIPTAKELDSRIPSTYHTNPDGTLCLGSRFQLSLSLRKNPTLLAFIDNCIVPFLYGHSSFEKYQSLPFGELAHGNDGLLEEYKILFGVSSQEACIDLLYLTGMKKRHANKYRCPCGSGYRLGKCHNQVINSLRSQLGRRWFQSEVRELLKY